MADDLPSSTGATVDAVETEQRSRGEQRPSYRRHFFRTDFRQPTSTLADLESRMDARRSMETSLWNSHRRSSLNAPTDFRLLDYVSSVDENLICAICRCPFIDQVTLSCEHTFCLDCLRQTWTEYHPRGPQGNCPACRMPTRLPSRQSVNKIVASILDDLEVKCPKHEQGCTAVVRRAQVRDHIKLYCDYGKVECYGPTCAKPVSRIDVRKGCLHFFASCIDCHEQLDMSEFHEHWSTQCSDRMLTCKLCSEKVFYRDLREHNTSRCTAIDLSCPGADIGCEVKLRRAKLNEHTKQCLLAKVAPSMAAQKQRSDEQESTHFVIHKRLGILEDGFKQIRSLLEESIEGPDDYSADETRIPYLMDDVERMGMPDSISTPDWRDLVDLDTSFAPPSEQRRMDFDQNLPPSRSRYSTNRMPVQHLMSMHEALREEVARVTTALSELDGRQSMHMLNENLRVRDELAYLSGTVAGMSRQLHWLTDNQLRRQGRSAAEGTATEYGDAGGAGAGVEAAVSAVASAAQAFRGVARMAGVSGSSSNAVPEMGGRLTRRSTNDENRTKL